MIEFGRSYIYDGKAYATMEEAQVEAVTAILAANDSKYTEDGNRLVAKAIVKGKAQVLAVLTLTDASRPRARGVRKPRKRAAAAPAQAEHQQPNLPAA